MALIPRGVSFRHPGADRGGPVDLAAARRILVVRPDNVGDVVLLTPALRALRAAAPHARIDLLASPAGADHSAEERSSYVSAMRRANTGLYGSW